MAQFLWSFLRYHIYGLLLYCYFSYRYLYDPDVRCKHAPLGNNQTGIEVLVAALSKSGTRTMMKSLYDIGYSKSYHSEDVILWVWSRLTDEFWADPSLSWPKPFWLSQRFDRHILHVMSHDHPSRFADAFSRCGVQAMSFDGLSRLFHPTYDASPGAKVIVLQWRSWKEQWKSFLDYVNFTTLARLFFMVLMGSLSLVPWHYLFLSVLEPMYGYPVHTLLEEGGPPTHQVMTPITMLYFWSVTMDRIAAHIGEPGLGWYPGDDAQWHFYYDTVRLKVPAEDRFEFDYRKHGYEDLCEFLNINPCPKKGRLPKTWNYLPAAFDFFWESFIWIPVALVCHVLNWPLLVWLPRACERRCWRLLCWLADTPLGRSGLSACKRLRGRLLDSAVVRPVADALQQAKSYGFSDVMLLVLEYTSELIVWLLRMALWLLLLPFRLCFRAAVYLLSLARRAVRCLFLFLWLLVATPVRILRWIMLAPFRLFLWLASATIRLLRRGWKADRKTKTN